MNYDNVWDKTNKKIQNELLKVAKETSTLIAERGDLEWKNSDSYDFLDINVGVLRDLLVKAYELGKNSK